MFLETPNRFLQWTVSAIRGWNGMKDESVNIHHIHGNKDFLIPIQNVMPDKVINGGGHVVTLTHPWQVNNFIKECCR